MRKKVMNKMKISMDTVLLLFSSFLLLAPATAAHADATAPATAAAAAAAALVSNSLASSLELKVGFSLSVFDYFHLTPVSRSSTNSTSIFMSIAIPAYNNSWFLPIISSPSFNSSNLSSNHDRSGGPGFSLGFFFNTPPRTNTPGSSFTSNIYFAVCGGLSGDVMSSNLSADPVASWVLQMGGDEKHIQTILLADGAALPVWIANPTTPLTSFDAYLAVVGTGNQELQLRDYNGVLVWHVSNAGRMEIQDSGTLVIYYIIEKSKVVWQSPRDTLFLGEKLSVGKQLTSSDGSYTARIEPGGFVLYDNTLQFMNEHPVPYWAVPFRLPTLSSPLNISKEVFFSFPCNSSNGRSPQGILDGGFFRDEDALFGLLLDPGSCSNSSLGIGSFLETNDEIGPLSFVRLEKDGWLHSYAVSSIAGGLLQQAELHMWDWYFSSDGKEMMEPELDLILQVSDAYHLMDIPCAVPNHCGPLAFSNPRCSCPPSAFVGHNNGNADEGCRRITALPDCKKYEHIRTTDFLQLNHTTTSFLFSGWAFNSTSTGNIASCKRLCASDCSCSGFFYVGNTSNSCFFIMFTNEMTLLNLTINHTKYGFQKQETDIWTSSYMTFLKITRSDISSTPNSNIDTHTPSSPNSNIKIVIAVVSSVVACLGLGLAANEFRRRAIRCRKLRMQAKLAAEQEEELRDVLHLLPSRFSYEELNQATQGFSAILGAGGCGSVYAGTLTDKRKVAVKTLEFTMKGQSKQFLAELATVGQTCHQNIVRLVGFCWEVSNRLLVYEYMERGSLDRWLFAKPMPNDGGAPVLNWPMRYNVVLGVARGLSYLHNECPQPILHFDIKPQNILLDDDFVPKLADFGMSRLMQRDMSEVVTGVRGTPGYIAPEWLSHGKVSKKSDVYSMGMVMLEVVGGRRNVDLELLNADADSGASGRDHEEWHFPSWAARRCERGLEMELVDKRLEGEFDREQARTLIYVAYWCIQEDLEMRPNVATVVQWLEGRYPVQQPPFSGASHAGSTSKLSLSL